MAHGITKRANGKAEMAYVGEVPWHGLGQPLQPGAKREEWLAASGMDFTVERGPVEWQSADGMVLQWPDRHVLYRNDNKMPLGIVGDGYKIVQPAEVLDFFTDLVDGAGFSLETAGTLHGGARYWALAKVGAEACVLAGDWVGSYLLLTTTADGKSSTEARLTTIRVVCQNTMTISLGANGIGARFVRIPHNKKVDPALIKAQLGVATGACSAFLTRARKLAVTKVAEHAVDKCIREVMLGTGTVAVAADIPLAEHAEAVRASKGYGAVLRLFNGEAKGHSLPGVAGTAWGLLNAFTEYSDHHTTRRSADARMESNWLGDGDAFKHRAEQEVCTLAEAGTRYAA